MLYQYAIFYSNELEKENILQYIWEYIHEKKYNPIIKLGYGVHKKLAYPNYRYKYIILCKTRERWYLYGDINNKDNLCRYEPMKSQYSYRLLCPTFGKDQIQITAYHTNYNDTIMKETIIRNNAAIIIQKNIRRCLAKQLYIKLKHYKNTLDTIKLPGGTIHIINNFNKLGIHKKINKNPLYDIDGIIVQKLQAYAILYNIKEDKEKILDDIYLYNKIKNRYCYYDSINKIAEASFIYTKPSHCTNKFRKKNDAHYRSTLGRDNGIHYYSDKFKYIIMCRIPLNCDLYNIISYYGNSVLIVKLGGSFGRHTIKILDENILKKHIKNKRNNAATIIQKYVRRRIAKRIFIDMKYMPGSAMFKKLQNNWTQNLNKLANMK